MEKVSVFNSLNSKGTIVGRLISKKIDSTLNVGDLVDVNGKIVLIESIDMLNSISGQKIALEVVNKENKTIVPYNLMSNGFKRVVTEGRVKINSLVVIVIKNTTDNSEPELLINNDGFAVIKNYVPKSYREEIPTPRFTDKEWIAIRKFQAGHKWAVSKFIDEDTITAGYGGIDVNGDFDYPLPTVYIKQIYGTTSWNQFLAKKGELV
jgi:hypothetical protein